ncbi:MAG: DUF4185 domain-containing protein [Verrucomicrobiota bacterium]
MSLLKFFSLGVFLFTTPFISQAAELKFTAKAAPELEAPFQNTNGWTGADAAFSIPLSKTKTVWLFGDTWVGEVRDGRRLHPKMINNSIALQTLDESPNFFYRTNSKREAESFVKPKEGDGFFWPFHGARTEQGLFIFLHQVKIVDSKSVFGFKVFGESFATITNPDDAPARWKIEQQKFPFATFSEKETITFGAAVLRHDGFIYVYGGRSGKEKSKRGMILARVPENMLANFSEWRFFANGIWKKNFHETTAIWPDGASEASVSFHSSLGKFITVHSQGIGGKIVLRTAESPAGPWSEPQFIFQCPDMEISKKVFCYAAKGHPELAANPNELIVTYAANSFNFWEVLSDARLYWPRFVRVEFK